MQHICVLCSDCAPADGEEVYGSGRLEGGPGPLDNMRSLEHYLPEHGGQQGRPAQYQEKGSCRHNLQAARFPQWKTAFLTKIPKNQINLRYRIFHEYFIKEVNGALDSRKIASVAIQTRNKQK